jgi:branched-chain amino acid transport system ATP-binding protein
VTGSESVSGGSQPLLRVEGLSVRYGAAQSLFDVSVDIPANGSLAVLGSNGAGKSTLARAISGLVPASGGTIWFDGKDITKWSPSKIRRAGLIHMPEGRGVFPALTVLENLQMALTTQRTGKDECLDHAFELFPVLGQRRKQLAGTLSGGEQQMLSLARALMVSPKLVIADEMSLGLAPKLVNLVFESLGRMREAGVTVLMIEQFASRALDFADSAIILQRGRVTWSGRADDAGEELLHAYLGGATAA